MKKFTRFIVTVAALFGAIACTTDATNDVAVQLGNNEGQTVISLSLEASRTQLGEKAGDLYPQLWSEGDKISVNGVESSALTAEQAGSAVAQFNVTATAPYCIAYPATSGGQVLFAEKQAHVDNTTFGSGVSTMYAYSESGMGVQMNHLTGVLKIGVTGSAKLALAQISNANRQPIAGAFDFDFVKGEIANASTSAKEVIEYSFGEGVQLSSEPTYLHVAVPAGVYDELYITLYDIEGGVMYATVKSDATKPLVAGNIREFKNNIAYAANESVFVVKDKVSLLDFASKAATLEKDVLFVADVDMAGEAWTPIEGYANTVRGNGYAIKGLTAPLFGTTNASIKGLHLRDVNITESADPNIGAFARKINATDDAAPVIENCSASGAISVNCTGAVTIANTYSSFAIGGFVGCVKGVSFDSCVNNINIDVDSVISTANKTVIYPSIAGIVGLIDAHTRTNSEVIISNLTNCENGGNIDVAMPRLGGTSEYENVVISYVAGVAARFKSANNACSVENLTNRGNITLSGYHGQGLFNSEDTDAVNYEDIDSCLAGVVGHLEITNGTNLANYGTISYTSGASRMHYIGGVAGLCGKSAVLRNLNNYGKIDLSTDTKMVSLHLGGVIAHTIAGSKLSDSNNSGEISVKCKTVGGGVHRYFRVGGVSAFADGSITNCHNLASGKVVCESSISKSGNWRDVCIAGTIAYKESNPVKDSSNNAPIYAKMTMAGGANDDSKRITVGGVIGISAQPCDNVTNNGRVEVWGTHHKLCVGGVIGDMNYAGDKKVGGYHLNGKVVLRGSTTVAYTSYIGGVAGYAKGTMTDVTVSENGGLTIGDDTTAATFTKISYIGGCFGYIEKTADCAISSVTNKGAVYVSGNPADTYYIGGVAGYALMPIHTADNYGKLSVCNLAEGGKRYIAGICPYLNYGGSKLVNHESADIDVTILKGSNTYIAGICGYVSANGEDFINKGDITVNGSISALTLISGAYSHSTLSNSFLTRIANEGNITINAECAGDTRIAGLQGDSNTIQNWTDCYNKGNITFSATAKATKALRIGGLMAYSRNANIIQTLNNCYNSGNITIEKGAAISCVEYVGGIFGDASHVAPVIENKILNLGNLNIDNDGNTAGNVYVGGIVGHTSVSIANADCYCEINCDNGITNKGWITGSARATGSVVASSCNIGGEIVEFDSSDFTAKRVPLSSDNFYLHIYGSGADTDWSNTSDYDGCNALTQKPEAPQIVIPAI